MRCVLSHECNDYIIRNGEFVRKFDEMYQSIDDPWDQKKTRRRFDESSRNCRFEGN